MNQSKVKRLIYTLPWHQVYHEMNLILFRRDATKIREETGSRYGCSPDFWSYMLNGRPHSKMEAHSSNHLNNTEYEALRKEATANIKAKIC